MKFNYHSLQHQLQVKWDKSDMDKFSSQIVDQIGSELNCILLQMMKNIKKIKNTDTESAPLL